MSIYIPSGGSGGVTVQFLQQNYTSKNSFNAGLSTKLSVTGGTLSGNVISGSTLVNLGTTLAPYGTINANQLNIVGTTFTGYIKGTTLTQDTILNIPQPSGASATFIVDYAGSTQTVDNLIINNLTVTDTFKTNGTFFVTGSDIGLNQDGYTNDGLLLDAYITNFQREKPNASLTIYLNSKSGVAIHNVVSFGSNINIIADCPIFYYGDGSLRYQGSFTYTNDAANLGVGTSYSEGYTGPIQIFSITQLNYLKVGDIVNIRGERDESGNSIYNQINRVASINTGSITVTFVSPLTEDFQYEYSNGSKTTINPVLSAGITSASFSPTENSKSCFVNTGINNIKVGDVCSITDFATIQQAFPNNTSNNTFRNDVNTVVAVDYNTNMITFAKPFARNYDASNFPVFIIPLTTVSNSGFNKITVSYRKYPTSRNIHPFVLNYCDNCRISDCTVKSNVNNNFIIVNSTVGKNFRIRDFDTNIELTITIPDGIYQIDDFCNTVTDLFIEQYNTAGLTDRSFRCSYNKNNGCISMTTNPLYKFEVLTSADVSTAYGLFGIFPETIYINNNSYTFNDVSSSGTFKLPIGRRKFYYQEATGGQITLEFPDFWYTLGSLLYFMGLYMTLNSPNGYSYTVSISRGVGLDVINFVNNNSQPFSIILTGKDDTFYDYICLHNARGEKISTLSGSSSYSTLNTSSVPTRFTCSSKGMGFRIDNSTLCSIDNCNVEQTRHLSSGEGYGFAVYRSSLCNISNSKTTQTRHSVLYFAGANYNVLNNFYDSGSTISVIDLHGADERYNTFSNITCAGGAIYSPDATQKGAVRFGNSTHIAGSSNNTVNNVVIGGYDNNSLYTGGNTYRNIGVVYFPNCSNNVVQNVNMNGGNIGIQALDISGRDGPDKTFPRISNNNVIYDSYFNNVGQPININMNNSGSTFTYMNNTQFYNNTFNNFGSGNTFSSVSILRGVTGTIFNNCTFSNIVSGSNDDYVINCTNAVNTKFQNCVFDNVNRGVYMNTGCGYYEIDNNIFSTLRGSSRNILRDAGGNTPNIIAPNIINSQNPQVQWDGSIANVTWRNTIRPVRVFTSNLTGVTQTMINTVLGPSPPSDLLGFNILGFTGATLATLSTVNPYGSLKITAQCNFQNLSVFTVYKGALLVVFAFLNGSPSVVSMSFAPPTDIRQFTTITTTGFYNYNTRLTTSNFYILANVYCIEGSENFYFGDYFGSVNRNFITVEECDRAV